LWILALASSLFQLVCEHKLHIQKPINASQKVSSHFRLLLELFGTKIYEVIEP